MSLIDKQLSVLLIIIQNVLLFLTGKSLAKNVDDDVPLVAAASDKQRSRIQIKKGPNGQEYEYEYVYYYYDDDEEPKDKVRTSFLEERTVLSTFQF